MSRVASWRVSLACSLVLMALIGLRWYHIYKDYKPESYQLPDQATVDTYWRQHWAALHPHGPSTPLLLPTGVFIQTFRFADSTTANLTGYIWHRYTKGVHDAVERGCVVFPEAVGGITCDKIYTHQEGNDEVEGWAFDVTVRQPFDYLLYPLDRQELWLRMQPPVADGPLLELVPDLGSYATTDVETPFGFNLKMDPGSWNIRNSFFSYIKMDYDTNFGLGGPTSRPDVPELAFNLILQRDILDGLMINIIPLVVIFLLLFATLLMITSDDERNARFGMSTSGVVGICSGLFFVAIVAHVQLRQQFPGSPILYLEYFYLLAYLCTLGVALNAYLAHTHEWSQLTLIRYRDNLIPKLLFWPLSLGLLLAISAWIWSLPQL